MKTKTAIIILIALIVLSAVGSFYVLARAEKPIAKTWRTMTPCFDARGKWYTR